MQIDVAEVAPVESLEVGTKDLETLETGTQPSWHFGGLAAHELLPQLLALFSEDEGYHQPPQACWLNNDGYPVIGILPKVAWRVYPADAVVDNEAVVENQIAKEVAVTVVKNTRATDANLAQPSLTKSSLTTELRYNTTYREWIEELIAYSQHYSQNNDDAAANPSKQAVGNHYQHGLMGFIGYDIAAKQLSPQQGIQLAEQPSAYLGHYDIYLSPCNLGWQLTVQPTAQETISPAYLDSLVAKLTQLDKQLTEYSPSPLTKNNAVPLKLANTWQYPQYESAFTKTQNYLYQGDSYQINLTQPWQGQLATLTMPNSEVKSEKLLTYLPALHNNTRAPFSGYVGLPNFELLSCSPELFLVFEKSTDGAQQIRTKPIKGTRPRGHDPISDQALRAELEGSDKDRAENVMIVDLLRNDLGKYAQTGSVKVPKIFAIESFSNVHHLVSTITATIKEEVHPLTVLFGSLPAGSITGTPKKRAVEIIAELEVAPRGAYCGTLGYMNFDGSGQWNVLIRTLQANHDGQVSLWAGGGITVGSDCAAEYQECVDKVGNLLGVLAKS